MKNYYDILGINVGATEDEIKRSYRKLAFKFHPDYNQGDEFFEARFRDIKEAYDILSDKTKRNEYNRKLYGIHNSINSTQQNAHRPEPNSTPNPPHQTNNTNNTHAKTQKQRDFEKPKSNIVGDAISGVVSAVASIIIALVSRLFFLGLVGGVLFGISKACQSDKTERVASNVVNGDLNNTFDNTTNAQDQLISSQPAEQQHQSLTPEQQYQKDKEALLSQGWNGKALKNGTMSECYNFNPNYGELKNYLAVNVGNNTDAVIKVVDQHTGECVRYVYINSNSSYKIKNIPEGIYYLKIAYGTDWISYKENGQCIGKFLKGALYKKGDEILDFRRQETLEGYSIPSYSLQLDVVASDYSNQFNSQSITESDFNN